MEERDDTLLSEENFHRAKQLVSEIESGNRDIVLQLVADMSSLVESELFQNVGKLTRNLHDSVRSIGVESSNEIFDAREFPDARDRLNHVIQLTEESANTTLSCVEEAIPIIQENGTSAAELLKRWEKLCKKELALSSFKDLSDDIQAYLMDIQQSTDGLQKRLNDVLMAQGFQDLTGQMIRQVISLVDDVEERLLQLVTMTGNPEMDKCKKTNEDERAAMMKGQGPAIPGSSDDVVKSQDDVDDLLASLGF